MEAEPQLMGPAPQATHALSTCSARLLSLGSWFCSACPSAGAEGSQLSAAGGWRLLCLPLLGESSFSAGQMGGEKGGWEPGCSGAWDVLSPELWNLEE